MAITQDWLFKSDFIEQFGEDDLPVDDNRVVDDNKLDEAIDSGITQVEAYLRPVGITIPFSESIQNELKLTAMDIVRYKYSNALQTGTEDVIERYNAAIAYLNKIASGKITLSEKGTNKTGKITTFQIRRG